MALELPEGNPALTAICPPPEDAALPKAGLATRMVLQVHDELVLEAPSQEVEEASRLVREVMEGAAQLKVRLAVDVGSGQNWLEAK